MYHCITKRLVIQWYIRYVMYHCITKRLVIQWYITYLISTKVSIVAGSNPSDGTTCTLTSLAPTDATTLG